MEKEEGENGAEWQKQSCQDSSDFRGGFRNRKTQDLELDIPASAFDECSQNEPKTPVEILFNESDADERSAA